VPAQLLAGGALLCLLCLLMTAMPVVCRAQAATVAASTEPAAASDPMLAGAAAIVARYPAKSIASLATANAALADVSREQAAIDTRHRAAQQACLPEFFMTRCLDAAKEKRRTALAMLRPLQIEADAFKRRERVVERDRLLEEKRIKAESAALAEQNTPQVIKPVPPPAQPGHARGAGSDTAPAPAAPRNVRTPHVAKPLTPPIDATTEARNMASYDRKVAESAQRQHEIAAKKAEKEQDRARKKAEADAAASASAKQAATPPK
jgi:colicin import membrane protein